MIAWHYRVQGPGVSDAWESIPAAPTAVNVHHLRNGEEYRFFVRAVNKGGPGPVAEVRATPLPRPPSSPGRLTARAGDGSVDLEWAYGGQPAVTRWQYRLRAGTQAYGGWQDGPAGNAATAWTVPGLANGTEYVFQVRGVGLGGPGGASHEVRATPMQGLPSKPEGLEAEVLGVAFQLPFIPPFDRDAAVAVKLSWDDPGDPTVFRWQYRLGVGDQPFQEWEQASGGTGSSTVWVVAGLEAGTSYRFQVRARNRSGTGLPSDEVSVRTPPASPSRLNAEPGQWKTTLSWGPSSDDSVTGWQYRVRMDGGGFGGWQSVPGGASARKHVVGGLVGGVHHWFELRAVNASGPGAVSDEVRARPVGATRDRDPIDGGSAPWWILE